MSESQRPNIYLALLHDYMVDKRGRLVSTSVTLIDVHDIARSCRTYGVNNYFISHSSPTLRELVAMLTRHWESGYGKEYNPNRQDALSRVKIITHPDEAVSAIEAIHGVRPRVIATSSRSGVNRISYDSLKTEIHTGAPLLLLFGTGFGMSDELLGRADAILEPIYGPTPYNFLSVRSAVAIILDRLLSR